MSQEEKKDNGHHENDGNKNNDNPHADTASASSSVDTPKPDAPTPDAPTPETVSTENSTAQTPPKKRSIGFLGRRGTAPIRTEAKSEEKKDDADDKKDSPPPKPVPVGFAEKLFFNISELPFLAFLCLMLFWVLHNFASVWLPSVYFKEELYLVEVYFDMLGLSQWFIPPATEHIEVAFPVFFWFMALVDAIPMTDSIFLPLVAAFSSLIALLGVYYLASSLGFGKKVSFAAGLLALASPALTGTGHFISLDLFTMGLFSLALGLLFKAWVSNSAPMYFILGFLCTALATLSIGYFPLWTILISSLFFIIWRTTFGRANKLDAVMGFGMLVLIFALWLMTIIISGGKEAEALNALMQHMIVPFTPPFWPLKPAWYSVFICLALGLAPWVLLPLFVSWLRVLKNTLPSLKAAHKESSGAAWLYINFSVGSVLIILGGGEYASLLLAPMLIVLLAKALCNFTALGSKVFYAVFALLIFVAIIACGAVYFAPSSTLWADYLPQNIANALPYLKGLEVICAILVIYALVLIKFTKRESPVGALLVVSLFTILLVQASTMLLAPSLVDNSANYNPLGVGKGTLPYGLGAPAIVLSLEKEQGLEPPLNTPLDTPTEPAPQAAPEQDGDTIKPTPQEVPEQESGTTEPATLENVEPEQNTVEPSEVPQSSGAQQNGETS